MNQFERLTQLAAAEMNARKNPRPRRPRNLDAPPLRCERDAEGNVALFGLGREPIVLSPDQWERLLDFGDEIRVFLQQDAQRPDRFWEDG